VQLPSGRVSLDGVISDIGIINSLLAKGPRLSVHGPGTFQASLEVNDLNVADGSHVEIDSDAITLGFLNYIANGQGQIQARLTAASQPSALVINANIANASLKRRGDSDNHIERLALSMRATGTTAEDTNALKDTQARIDLHHGQIQNIQVYNSYLPHNSMAKLVSGQAQLDGWWELDATTGVGELTLNATRVVAKIRDQLVTGALKLDGKLADGDLKTMRFDIGDTELTLDNVVVLKRDAPPWTGSLKITEGKLRLSSPLEVDGVMDLTMLDTRPFVDLFGTRDSKPKWLPNLFNVKNVKGTTKIKLDDRDLTLTDLTLTGDNLKLQGQLRFADKNLDGIAYAKYRKFGAAVELKGKEREWHLVKPKKKFAAYQGLP